MKGSFYPAADTFLVQDNKKTKCLLEELGKIVRNTTCSASLHVGAPTKVLGLRSKYREILFYINAEMPADRFNSIEGILMDLGPYCMHGVVIEATGENGEMDIFTIGPNDGACLAARSSYHARKAQKMLEHEDISNADILEVIKNLAEYIQSRG
jgi:hypothetical protein